MLIKPSISSGATAKWNSNLPVRQDPGPVREWRQIENTPAQFTFFAHSVVFGSAAAALIAL